MSDESICEAGNSTYLERADSGFGPSLERTDSGFGTNLERTNSDEGWGAADANANAGDEWGDVNVKPDGELDDASTEPDLVPMDVRRLVEDDVRECRLVERFTVANASFPGSTQITVRVGFPVTALKLGEEQARAWMVDPSKFIAVDVSLPPHYFSCTHLSSHIRVSVHQLSSFDSTNKAGFKLSWTLEQRIRQKFLGPLLTNPEKRKVRPYSIDDALEIAEITVTNYYTALSALKREKWNKSKAMEMITSLREKQEESLPSSSSSSSSSSLSRHSSSTKPTPKRKKSGKILSYFGKKTKTDDGKQAEEEPSNVDRSVELPPTEKERQLMELAGCSQSVASQALTVESDANDAYLLLCNPESRSKIEEMAISASPRTQEDLASDDTKLALLLANYNPLVALLVFVEEQLLTINQSCLLCGNPIEYPGLKPSVCGHSLCKFGMEGMGLSVDLSSEVRNEPEICDLLISFAFTAARENKMPFVQPTNVSVRVGSQEIDLLSATNKSEVDLRKLSILLEKCPSIKEMREWENTGKLQERLDKIDPLLAPVLRWIISSNRAHLRVLRSDERIDKLPSTQFVLLSSTPDHEMEFQRLKREAAKTQGDSRSSFFAWHGSAAGNWHSILRVGVKNMSGTKYQANGAAYGSGIYMAADSGTSFGYARSRNAWSKSMFGDNFVCLALCEVVNSVNPPNPFYVVPEEHKVATRFIIVFPPSNMTHVAASALKIPRLPTSLDLSKLDSDA